MININKTKVICTIGPATNNYETFRKLVIEGMDVARINLCHANSDNRQNIIELVNKCNQELNTNVAIMCDLKGPKIRTCDFENDEISLIKGEYIYLVKETLMGTKEKFSLNYPEIIDSLELNSMILLDDGLVRLKVVDIDKEQVKCLILDSETIKSKRGVNIPGVDLKIPFLGEEDIENIKFIAQNNIDFVALSFVNNKENVLEVRSYLDSFGGSDVKIISKIESAQSVKKLSEIIDVSYGLMVARGDLGLEMEMPLIPIIQKKIVEMIRKSGKTVIVATEMLASMYESSRPTRAELTDVSNAVFDGTDAVMLSGETTIGKYPVEALKYMIEICKVAEKNADFDGKYKNTTHDLITDNVTESLVKVSKKIEAKLIVVVTKSGILPEIISNLKPNCSILAVCEKAKKARGLALSYGVNTVVGSNKEEIIKKVKNNIKELMALGEIHQEDAIIITEEGINSKIINGFEVMTISELAL